MQPADVDGGLNCALGGVSCEILYIFALKLARKLHFLLRKG
jgi:hypothetical protein